MIGFESEVSVATAAIDKINKPHDLPKVKRAPVHWGGGLMVIPHPKEVLAIMKSVPHGRTLNLDTIRAQLAKAHNSDIACPMTTGIFVSLAAHAHEEGSDSVPYWRTLRKNGELNAKLPGGIEAHKKKLQSEGHIVFAKGKRLYVKEICP